MRFHRLFSALPALAALVMVACGTPGAPQPPSLELPRTVQDLRAARKGDRVTLSWKQPSETTDRTRIKHMGVTKICRGVDVVAMEQCGQAVGTLPAAQMPSSGAAQFTDVVPIDLQGQHRLGFASYAVEVENTRGRSAGLSNQVMVPLAPTLPPPGDVKAQVTPEGVELTFTGMLHEHDADNRLRHFYRVYRREAGAQREMIAGEVSLGASFSGNLVDHAPEWEKRYVYKVTAVTVEPLEGKDEQIEGEDSPAIEVFVHDVFPPAVPAGLQAVSSGRPQQPFIDLTWAPNTESDLAGYNLYRQEEGGMAVKLNTELVKTPAFRDTTVQPGHRYAYTVTAVDLRGNESGHSGEASESVPTQ